MTELIERMKAMHKELTRRQDVDRQLKRIEEAHMSQQVGRVSRLVELTPRAGKDAATVRGELAVG